MNLIVDQVWSGVAAGLPSRPANGKLPQILFIVPWRNKSMIGTWHIPWNNPPEAFQMNEAVVQEFIDEINSAHPPLKLLLDHVQHITWGFLPVKKEDTDKKSVKLTRDGVVIDHQKKDGVFGLISVLGVKYTTARAVAEQAVDVAVDKLGIRTTKCQTEVVPVQGGQIADFKAFMKQAIATVPRGIHEEIMEHLVYTYGSEYTSLIQYIKKQPEWGARTDPSLPVTIAEVMHAILSEMALTLADVIQRRTELGATGLPSITTLQKCAALMGRELSWSLERQQQEIDSAIQAYPFKQIERVTV
jgi:glycerol-3-phosphate dehydrogenase